jgi:hypothetical protein
LWSKKIGSRIVTRLPIQKNNDTKILLDSRTKIPDAISVFGDDNQVSLMQSEKQVRLERLSLLFSLSNYSLMSAT